MMAHHLQMDLFASSFPSHDKQAAEEVVQLQEGEIVTYFTAQPFGQFLYVLFTLCFSDV